ncbi:cyclopropane fatty acyl phospholipid synthase [Kistimonas scapharcae]|uniref:Cyclopropane fatty acyl phospholipid synthase n=1 Tax=Kistimonas scapharcae TaxID=1036133 RepID=A0ABP8V1L0_9GAMM
MGTIASHPVRTGYARRALESLLSGSGIQFDGTNPWDIHVHDARFYSRVLRQRSLGLGESYMDGWWDCEQLDALFHKLLQHRADRLSHRKLGFILDSLKTRLFNLQSRRRAFDVGEQHYNLGNDLFSVMLDPSMSYSCGYWKTATTLAEAQEAKLRLICEKLQLAPGMTLLDIGCGWGGLAEFAATHYGVEVTGITISDEQMTLACDRTRHLPVSIILKDYREMDGQFDRAVSVGMFEHVGEKNYRLYMETVHRLLKPGGYFLLHTIGNNTTTHGRDPWIHKYIFPNGEIPSPIQLTRSIEPLFVLEDWQNFGPDYDRTLLAWHENFKHHWPELKPAYNQRFYRMWTYYLLCFAGVFRARELQLWQLVLSHGKRPNRYDAAR